MGLTIGSLFSGIGGLEKGLERALGATTIWQVEQNPYCLHVLEKHWPDARRHNDVRHVGRANLSQVDVLCGGFPCQDISSAGKGKGLAGKRSGLWREFARVVSELQPKWVVVENVSSGAKQWVDPVVQELGKLGYEALPLPISASDTGAPHRRARIFVVARRIPNSDSGEVRDGSERGSERRPGGVCDQRQSQPTHLGSGVADPHSGGLEGVRVEEHGDEQSQIGLDSDGCRDNTGFSWPPGPLDDAGWERWLAAGNPPPGVKRPVRGGANGLSRRMDRRFRREALQALGNSVVPQCAEIVGYVILELIKESERAQSFQAKG